MSSPSSKANFDFDIESKVTLHESLVNQLIDFDLNKKQIELSTIIIGCIDENGMLVDEIDEIEELSKYIFNSDEIEEILKNIIQKMTPYGVGYRNYKELFNLFQVRPTTLLIPVACLLPSFKDCPNLFLLNFHIPPKMSSCSQGYSPLTSFVE